LAVQGLGAQVFSHLTGQGLGAQVFSHLTGQGFGHDVFEQSPHRLQGFFSAQGFSHLTGQGFVHVDLQSPQALQGFVSHFAGQGFAHDEQSPHRLHGLAQDTFFSGHFFSCGQGFSHLLPQHPPRAKAVINSPLNQPTCLILMMLLPFVEPSFPLTATFQLGAL
jgi:hypothetical protein